MINIRLLQFIQQYKNNPLEAVSKGFNLPDGMTDPNEILKHLLDSGQVSQKQVDNIQNYKQYFK